GGTPAGNSNGVIGDLFSLPTGLSSASFTVTGKINASAPTFALQAALTAYDNTNTPASGASDFSKVDLAFYFSDCGDGVVDSPEQCDTGSANGTTGSCCTSTCTFKTNGTACTDDGNVCTTDLCNGSSGVCQHAPGNAGTQCRASAGICDPAENCTGSSSTCPANAFSSSTTTCRASAGLCDTPENCTGSSAACPPDGKSTAVCRASAGPCDVAESCDGVGNNCPPDGFQPATPVCRASAGVFAPASPGRRVPAEHDRVPSRGRPVRRSRELHRVERHVPGRPLRVAGDGMPPGGRRLRRPGGLHGNVDRLPGGHAVAVREQLSRGGGRLRRGRDVHGFERGLSGRRQEHGRVPSGRRHLRRIRELRRREQRLPTRW